LNNKKVIREYELATPLFYGFWVVLNAMMAFRIRGLGTGMADFANHNVWSEQILNTGFDLSNLYHNGVAFFMSVFGMRSNFAGALLVFIMQMIFITAIHYWTWRLLKDYVQPKWILFAVAVPALAGSLPNFFGPHFMYHFAFGINVWHNPTSFTVMPFVILSFFLFCQILILSGVEKPQRIRTYLSIRLDSYYVNCFILAVLLFLSVYGKVSWLPLFAMAALIFLFVWWASSKFSIERLKYCAIVGLCFIPAGILTLWVSNNTIYSTEFALGITSTIRPFSIILNLVFPIFVACLCYKKLKVNKFYQIAWMTYISALLQAVFIIEGGGRESHGNMTWWVLYALTILIMVSLMEFIKYLYESHSSAESKRLKWVVPVGLSLAAVHLFSGVYYALHIYFGGTFWF